MACNIYPFTSIHILPAYGPNTARILWSISNPVFNNKSTTLIIQKSKDGYTNWFDINLLNPLTKTCVGIDDCFFLDKSGVEDPKLGRYNQRVEWYYRFIVKVNKSNQVFTTDPITSRHNLTDLEFGTLREILNLEYTSPDAVDMLLFRPTTIKEDPMRLSELSSNINPLTGQVMGTAVDDVAYGKTYGNDTTATVTAFSKPILVTVSIKQNVYKQVDLENGHGSTDNIVTQFTSCSYPMFKRGDLIVDPINDRRFLFDQVINVAEFKGVIPLTFTGQMTQLSRNDPMYKVPVDDCILSYFLKREI